MSRSHAASLAMALSVAAAGVSLASASACTVAIIEATEDGGTETGDGDGDPAGDGDGDDSSGDGDGDDSTGDGDGDDSAGDGDGDGDGSAGDGDTSGDGDGDDTAGDGDGDDTDTGDGDGDALLGDQIAVGDRHACTARNGELYCWGTNNFGQLGYGNTTNIGDDELPLEAGVVPVGANVLAITTGHEHSCALTEDAGLRCWGSGANGRLGYSNTNNIGDDETPDVVLDLPLGTQAASVDAGTYHTCAVTSTGGVRCWGAGIYLGYGMGGLAVGDDETPASVGDIELGGVATAVSSGEIHSCALLAGGSVRCWGSGTFGTLGYGNLTQVGVSNTPADVGDLELGGLVAELSAGRLHSCARLINGDVRCWGSGADGRLGYANVDAIGDDELPASVEPVELGGPAIDIAAGWDHSCALLEGGDVRCWGRSTYGQLGYGNTNSIGDDETPASVVPVDIGGPAVEIAVGHAVSCALRDNGGIYCWGWGGYGSLGQGNLEHIGDDETPASVGPILL